MMSKYTSTNHISYHMSNQMAIQVFGLRVRTQAQLWAQHGFRALVLLVSGASCSAAVDVARQRCVYRHAF